MGIAEYIERSLGNDIRTKATVPAIRYSRGLQEKIPPSLPVSHYLRYRPALMDDGLRRLPSARVHVLLLPL